MTAFGLKSLKLLLLLIIIITIKHFCS